MQIKNDMIHIRLFRPGEAELYKAMRLEALRLEPGLFGNSLALEAAFEKEVWIKRLEDPAKGTFGLFDGDRLIGITAILKDAGDPMMAYMTQSYIRAAYRGRGLSRLLYDARIQWARAHGVRRLTIGHRRSNAVSKAANRHYGFVYTHSELRLWPDGAEEEMYYYVLELGEI